MVRGAIARGHRRLVFKPHPTAPDAWSRTLVEAAEELGAALTVEDRPVLAEVLYRELRPALVVGCFSTALLTAATFYGVPVARVGTRALLERLTPFQNSNRIPLTVVDAVVPPLEAEGDDTAVGTEELNDLVAAVGFAMQPKIRPELREPAVRHLSGPLAERTRHHFTRRRLTVLNLPGGLPIPRHPRSAGWRAAHCGCARRRKQRRPRRPHRPAAREPCGGPGPQPRTLRRGRSAPGSP
ncbi:hypothetical protein STANM309S_05019 [Streptomyces tanashiensis]